MHRFHSFAFAATPHPRQLVVGNSGVHLGTAETTEFANTDGKGLQIAEYYLEVTLGGGSSWSGVIKDHQGNTIGCCDESREQVCEQASSCATTAAGSRP